MTELTQIAQGTLLISGAAAGIGRAVAEAAAAWQLPLGLIDRDEAGLKTLTESLRKQDVPNHAIVGDVSDPSFWPKAIAETTEKLGTIRHAVLAAGIGEAMPVENADVDHWRRVLSVNLDGIFLAARCLFGPMRETGGGTIINIASSAGIKATPGAAAYCVSKAGVRMFSRVLALEGARHNIRVNSISPGVVLTEIWEKQAWWTDYVQEAGSLDAAHEQLLSTTPLRRATKVEEIAAMVRHLISDASASITGEDIVMDGGLAAQ